MTPERGIHASTWPFDGKDPSKRRGMVSLGTEAVKLKIGEDSSPFGERSEIDP
jgi:hypothetical protein